jgi:hypothetical protein
MTPTQKVRKTAELVVRLTEATDALIATGTADQQPADQPVAALPDLKNRRNCPPNDRCVDYPYCLCNHEWRKRLADQQSSAPCRHEWIAARNEIKGDGYWCGICGEFSTTDPKDVSR